MALATNTTPGSVILSGDLTGKANVPELRVTGVVPGQYLQPHTIVIDSKGRLIYSSPQYAFEGKMYGSPAATSLDTPYITVLNGKQYITPGKYIYPTLTVQSDGRIVAAIDNRSKQYIVDGDLTGTVVYSDLDPNNPKLVGVVHLAPLSAFISAGTQYSIRSDGRVVMISDTDSGPIFTGDMVGTVKNTVLSTRLTGVTNLPVSLISVENDGLMNGLTGNSTYSFSGELQGGFFPVTGNYLEAININPGNFNYPNINVNAGGRISYVTGVPATLTGDLNGSYSTTSLASVFSGTLSTTFSQLVIDSKGRVTYAATKSKDVGGDFSGTYTTTALPSRFGGTLNTKNPTFITVNDTGILTNFGPDQLTFSGKVLGAFGTNYLANSGVTANTYTYSSITVGSDGIVTSASTNAEPLFAGVVNGYRSSGVYLANFGAGSNTKIAPDITVDAGGRISLMTRPVATTTVAGTVSLPSSGEIFSSSNKIEVRVANGTTTGRITSFPVGGGITWDDANQTITTTDVIPRLWGGTAAAQVFEKANIITTQRDVNSIDLLAGDGFSILPTTRDISIATPTGGSTGTNFSIKYETGNQVPYSTTTGSAHTIAGTINKVAFSGTYHVGVGGGFAYKSIDDGVTWTSVAMPNGTNWTDIIWNGSKWLAISTPSDQASYDMSYTMSSTDGVTWTDYTQITTTGGYVLDGHVKVIWSKTFNAYYAVNIRTTVVPTNNTVVYSNYLATSTNGITWTLFSAPSSNILNPGYTYWSSFDEVNEMLLLTAYSNPVGNNNSYLWNVRIYRFSVGIWSVYATLHTGSVNKIFYTPSDNFDDTRQFAFNSVQYVSNSIIFNDETSNQDGTVTITGRRFLKLKENYSGVYIIGALLTVPLTYSYFSTVYSPGGYNTTADGDIILAVASNGCYLINTNDGNTFTNTSVALNAGGNVRFVVPGKTCMMVKNVNNTDAYTILFLKRGLLSASNANFKFNNTLPTLPAAGFRSITMNCTRVGSQYYCTYTV